MAEMVWCQSCKTVVWAYDAQPRVDLRGICNMFRLACPKCGAKGNYDGWGCNKLTEKDRKQMELIAGQTIYDMWSLLRAVAKSEGMAWEPSGDNTWTKRTSDD